MFQLKQTSVSAIYGLRFYHRCIVCSRRGRSSAEDFHRRQKQNAAATVYKPGADVKAPKLIHYVEPEFSDSSNEAFVDGMVKISTVVSSEGVPTELHILSGLNSKEDSTAVEAVKQWRFEPGTKAGEAVNVEVTVEVNFHLL